MFSWILTLLVVAAVAGLLSLSTLSGLAMTGAKVFIGFVLAVFLLVILGVVSIV